MAKPLGNMRSQEKEKLLWAGMVWEHEMGELACYWRKDEVQRDEKKERRKKRNEEKQVARKNKEEERQVSSGFCPREGNITRGGSF